MEFTVFTTAGGFREFPGDSSFEVGEHNGVLSVFEASTGQLIVYGPHAWASVQQWTRDTELLLPGGESRLEGVRAGSPDPGPEELTEQFAPHDVAEPIRMPLTTPGRRRSDAPLAEIGDRRDDI